MSAPTSGGKRRPPSKPAATAREEKPAETVDLTFSPASVGPEVHRSAPLSVFMNSPSVRAKLASASTGKSTTSLSVTTAHRPARADTSVVSQQPQHGMQSDSQFLTWSLV